MVVASAGRAFASITNTGDSPVTVMLTADHDTAQSVLLPPHGTQVADISSQASGSALRSLSLKASAKAGVIRASGFVTASNGSYVNTLRFLDPALSLSNSLYATGLILSGKDYVLAVKNTTNQAITLAGRAYLSSVNGKAASPRQLVPEIVPAGGTISLRLEKSVGDALKQVVALALRTSASLAPF